jgi:DeoR/GlpR family transcriptional regulator of sugar metabolism
MWAAFLAERAGHLEGKFRRVTPQDAVLSHELSAAVLARSNRKILLADASKWLQPRTVKFAAWTAFDAWVTDKKPAAQDAKSLNAQGVEIHAKS